MVPHKQHPPTHPTQKKKTHPPTHPPKCGLIHACPLVNLLKGKKIHICFDSYILPEQLFKMFIDVVVFEKNRLVLVLGWLVFLLSMLELPRYDSHTSRSCIKRNHMSHLEQTN